MLSDCFMRKLSPSTAKRVARLTLHTPAGHLGDVHRHEGQAKLAEGCYLAALALYRGRQETPSLDLANAIRPLAILKDDAGEVEEARRLWEEARSSSYVAPAQVKERNDTEKN